MTGGGGNRADAVVWRAVVGIEQMQAYEVVRIEQMQSYAVVWGGGLLLIP